MSGRRIALGMAALAVIVTGGAAMANPWPKEPGSVEVISSATITRQQAGLAAGATANAFSELHLEYGAWQTATIIAESSFQQYALGGQSRPVFDTAWIGGRLPLLHWDNSLVSLEAGSGLSGVRENASAGAPLDLDGTGVARLMFGQGFEIGQRHAFAGIEAGWRWRGGAPADELIFDATVGMEPWSTGLVMLQSFSIAAAGGARAPYRPYDLMKLQLSLAQRLTPHWWIQAGAIATVAGADAGEAGGIFALWWRH